MDPEPWGWTVCDKTNGGWKDSMILGHINSTSVQIKLCSRPILLLQIYIMTWNDGPTPAHTPYFVFFFAKWSDNDILISDYCCICGIAHFYLLRHEDYYIHPLIMKKYYISFLIFYIKKNLTFIDAYCLLMKRNLVLILLLNVISSSFSQNTIGIPDIVNYPKSIYNAGTSNWDIAQDKNGIVYFANNEGLLSFDGTYWRLYPLPNKTNVRSLEITDDGKIYVGGQDELGFFSAGKAGTLVYTSLKNLIPVSDRSFTDVWEVISFKNEIFFRSVSAG